MLDRHGRSVGSQYTVLAADGPVGGQRRVHGRLDVGTVEVGFVASGEVGEFGGEAEDVPKEGTLLVDFVDVEAWVYLQSSVVYGVKYVTFF